MEQKIKIEKKEKIDKKLSIAELLLITLTFFLPILFVPATLVDTFTTKAFLVLFVIYLVLFIWSIRSMKSDKFKVPFNLISLSIVIVVLVNIASSLFSDNFDLSFWGKDFGFNSSISILSLFLLMFLGSFIFRRIKTATYTYVTLFLSSIIVFIWHLLLIVFPDIIPDFGFFFANTTNTIGKWFDLGVFVGLMTILSLVTIEFLKVSKRLKISLYLYLGFSLILQFIIGFSELWLVLGIFSLGFFIYFLVMNKKYSKDTNVNLPVSSLVVLVVSFVILMSGLSLNSRVQNLVGIDFADYRPSVTANYQITKEAIKENPILGEGPGTFVNSWTKYKPDSINLTELWNVDFRFGYGLIPTYFTTTGILGTISWILFFGMFLFLGFTSMFKSTKTSLGRYILTSSFIGSLYLWVMSIIYIPSYVTLTFTFIFTAVFIASLYREKFIREKEFSISDNPKYGFLYIFIVIAILIGSLTILYNFTEKYVSNIYTRQGLVDMQQNNVEQAEQKLLSAISFKQSDNLFINLSDIRQSLALSAQNNSDLSESDRSTLFQNYLSGSIEAASAAVEYDPQNYQNFLYLGNIFTDLVSLEVEGVETRAIEFLEEAKRLSPKNPQIPLSLARIYIATEDYETAKDLINESLELKSNYTEAVYLLSQINVIEGEIETAIENVRLTTLVRPNDPVTYFQLGLLQYQNEDFEQAIESFESAVIRNSLYSNAKYFLGLSYYQVDRQQDATNQFTDLEQLNPGNQEIEFILNNLQQGQSPFAGASNETPPIDDQPENREEPPLEDDETVDDAETADTTEAVDNTETTESE